MPEIDVNAAGAVGLLSDMAPMEVGPNGWTSGRNVRFHRGEVVAFPGHDLGAAFPDLASLWALGSITSPVSHFWLGVGTALVGGATTVYAYDGTSFTDVTGAAMTATQANVHVGDGLNGNAVFTNGIDLPRYWPANVGVNFETLPGWDVNWRCKLLSAFKGFLIASNMVETGSAFPYRVRWSSQAPPGGIPQSWDETDPTVLANVQDLGDATEEIRAQKPLRDVFMLYTDKETIGMQFVGGNNLWRFYVVSRESGALSPRSVATFRGQHVVLSDRDVVRCNGQQVQSIIEHRMRDYLFRELNYDLLHLCWVNVNHHENEVWVAFPAQDATYCNLALVWNWHDDTWGVRDLPPGNFDSAEVLNIVGDSIPTWNTISGTWAQQANRWNTSNFLQAEDIFVLGGDPVSGTPGARVLRVEQGNLYDGQSRTMRVEKLGMRLNGDSNFVAHEMFPRAHGGPMRVYIGSQDKPNGSVRWGVQRDFDPEQERKVTFRLSGRYLCVAFESDDVAGLRLQGYGLRWQPRGSR